MHKLIVKLFAEQDTFAPTEFVPIFHRWIQTHALADHLLIDVADYAHVPAGPGTLVVASEANIHMDRGGNELGLLYVRKLPIAGAVTLSDTVVRVIGYALSAAALMQSEPVLEGRLRFRTDEIALRFNNRLDAPNTAETFERIKGDVQAAVETVFGAGTRIDRFASAPEQLLEIRIRCKAPNKLQIPGITVPPLTGR
jgi:hypothetical protein